MTLMVLDREVAARLKADRKESGLDRYDEVWEGIYMMAPIGNLEHQHLQSRLVTAIQNALGFDSPAYVDGGANVSDREEDWTQNYRVPDVVVTLPGGVARDCRTHYYGGPDFVIEILSPGDRARDKFDFYAAIGVRELMLIDRDPWTLELHRLVSGRFEQLGKVRSDDPLTLKSDVVPVSFRLIPGTPIPRIVVSHHDGVQTWTV